MNHKSKYIVAETSHRNREGTEDRNVSRCPYRFCKPGYGIIGKQSENLARSRRCMGGAVCRTVTGKPGRQDTVLMPESEDLPDT